MSITKDEQKEFIALQKQIALLKKELDYEQMKHFAFKTKIDLAKEVL